MKRGRLRHQVSILARGFGGRKKLFNSHGLGMMMMGKSPSEGEGQFKGALLGGRRRVGYTLKTHGRRTVVVL